MNFEIQSNENMHIYLFNSPGSSSISVCGVEIECNTLAPFKPNLSILPNIPVGSILNKFNNEKYHKFIISFECKIFAKY